jgi:hypothetical protein
MPLMTEPPQDDLRRFASERMAAHGPTKAPVDPREEFRRLVRDQLVSSYRESIFIALMFVAIGGAPVVWSFTSHFDAHWRHGVAPLCAYTAVFLVLAGVYAWHGPKWYGFPWDLERRGTVGRGSLRKVRVSKRESVSEQRGGAVGDDRGEGRGRSSL